MTIPNGGAHHIGLSKVEKYAADVPAYRVLVMNGVSGEVEEATAPSQLAYGVSFELGGEAGQFCDVVLEGIVPLTATAAIAPGAQVAIADGGIATAATGNYVVGIARGTAAQAGENIPVLLKLGGIVAA